MSLERDQLLKSRDAMLVVLDTKLKDVPEWTAYRAMEAFLQVASSATTHEAPLTTTDWSIDSYANLALKALQANGRPTSTPELLAFIASHRKIPADPRRARSNIAAALSRDKRLRSVSWRGGRGWWHADRPLPGHLLALEQSAA
jgi:hypothetical protein